MACHLNKVIPCGRLGDELGCLINVSFQLIATQTGIRQLFHEVEGQPGILVHGEVSFARARRTSRKRTGS